jgi:hypothetical protein
MERMKSLLTNEKPTTIMIGDEQRLHYTPMQHNSIDKGKYRIVLSNSRITPANEDDNAVLNGLKKCLKEAGRDAHGFTMEPFVKKLHPKHGRLHCTIFQWSERPPVAQATLLTMPEQENNYAS